jgi:uncharacterized membrane protein
MKWFTWAVLSAFFAGLTAVLAKVRPGIPYVACRETRNMKS